MSLLERVQAIVPEACCLAEAIQIQGVYYRRAQAWRGDTIEESIRLNNKRIQILEALITLQEMSREFWGPTSKPVPVISPQEATA